VRRHLVAAFVCLLAIALTTGAAAAPRLEHLDPGELADLRERVPVNFVFVGYEPNTVDPGEFLSGLPDEYRPVVRSRLPYGITEFLGLRYTYDYEVTYASSSYEDAFFAELSRLAQPARLTEWQRAYNEQSSNVLDVAGNHLIDAPSVERWLAHNPPRDVDTGENTIVFVNWYGRDDYKHHVYVKTNEPDPDTGHNFGIENSNRKIIAWGGTTPDDEENGLGDLRRVWFYDLSAGPEAWTDNWNVDDLDLPEVDENFLPDYRMPPIWEYAEEGFRDPSELPSDLAKVARYVGIDLLFTTSPLYPPDVTGPVVPTSIDFDATTYEGWRGVDASGSFIKPALLVEELSEIQPARDLSQDYDDAAFSGRARTCYALWLASKTCFPQRAYPAFANLFVYNDLRVDELRDDHGRVDYEMPLVNYATGPSLGEAGLLGYADDNYRDGSQSVVFSFVSPLIIEAGYGLTTTMIHEAGHHLGLSHPHDGYDYEDARDFEPADDLYFAWSGSESNSMMSYIDLNWDFSQFDRDNMSRFLTAAYISAANEIAEDLLEARASARGEPLHEADEAVGAAKEALKSHRYEEAALHALRAYEEVRAAAEAAGVAVPADDSGTEVDPPVSGARDVRSEHGFVDYLGRRGHRAWP
jgi:hypothetical protein